MPRWNSSRSRTERNAALACVILGLVLVGSCQKRQDDPRKKVSPSAARAEVLAAVSQCMLSTYQAGHAAVLSLRDAAQAAKADPTAEKRAAAETAWSSAMEIWQQAEVMQIGPAASVALPGGKNLRDEIYSWPLTGRCLVEQQLVSKSYEASTFSTALVNLRGLDAAEYLLFYKADDNACAANATINSGGTWAALGAAEITARKAAYAAVVADDIVVSATKLLDAWEPAKGNFVAQLETAGRGSATWSTDLSAVNAVSDALFYIEKQVKDMKLGRPLGLLECASATCPEALESRYAHRSKQHIRNNLVGFSKLFGGCDAAGEGKGLEDLLSASGASDLAQRVANALSGAVAAVDAIEEDDLEEALAKDYASVKALHEAIKVLTDLLKNELVIVLGVELPKTVDGDND